MQLELYEELYEKLQEALSYCESGGFTPPTKIDFKFSDGFSLTWLTELGSPVGFASYCTGFYEEGYTWSVTLGLQGGRKSHVFSAKHFRFPPGASAVFNELPPIAAQETKT